MTTGDPHPHLLRGDRIAADEEAFSHPWSPKSEITGTWLSQKASLEGSRISLVRVAPGKESFAYHLHHCEEEWIYVLFGCVSFA